MPDAAAVAEVADPLGFSCATIYRQSLAPTTRAAADA
jgi:hypothetical protein